MSRPIAYDSRMETVSSEDEEILLQRLTAGDREAAERLLEGTYERIYRSLCRMTGDRDQAADLTQDTYRKAWQALPSFDGRSLFSTWLYKVAYTTFLNSLRRPRLVEPLPDSLARTMPSSETPADTAAVETERERRTRAAVLELPDDLRFVITAHYWGDLSVSEVARATGITAMGVRKRLHRAQTALARSLGDLK